MFEFGNLRYATVSNFKGKEYVNIREYYVDKVSIQAQTVFKALSLFSELGKNDAESQRHLVEQGTMGKLEGSDSGNRQKILIPNKHIPLVSRLFQISIDQKDLPVLLC